MDNEPDGPLYGCQAEAERAGLVVQCVPVKTMEETMAARGKRSPRNP